MNNQQECLQSLRQKAKQAARHAYQPYSQFAVGAALKLKDGTLIPGCNVENASYGLSNCAERTAIFSALSQGFKPDSFEELMIYMPGEKLYSPCGACRQVMAEFFPANAKVHASCDGDKLQSWTVAELLPGAFGLL